MKSEEKFMKQFEQLIIDLLTQLTTDPLIGTGL